MRVKELEREIFKTLTTRIEFAIDEAHFLAGTVPLITGDGSVKVDAKLAETCVDVFLKAQEARKGEAWSSDKISKYDSRTREYLPTEEFVDAVAKKLYGAAATKADLSYTEATALAWLTHISRTKVHEKNGGFGWGIDTQTKEKEYRAAPYGSRTEMDRVCSSQYEEIMTNLFAREVLGEANKMPMMLDSMPSTAEEMRDALFDKMKNLNTNGSST